MLFLIAWLCHFFHQSIQNQQRSIYNISYIYAYDITIKTKSDFKFIKCYQLVCHLEVKAACQSKDTKE